MAGSRPRDYSGDHGDRADRHRPKGPERSAIQPCTKLTLFFWNFATFIVGVAMTSLGAYILVMKGKVVHEVLDFFLDPACDVTLAGGIITVVGFFGCYGSLRENMFCLKIYYMSLCLFLLIQLGLSIMMFVCYYVPDAKDTLFPHDLFRTAILNYREDPDMQHLIDSMQQELSCCGMSDNDKGFLDWNDNVYFNCTPKSMSPEACSVPFSCCKTKPGDTKNYQCGYGMMQLIGGEIAGNDENTQRIYTDGCLKALEGWINSHALIVGGVMLGVLAPQIFIVILTRNLIEMILLQKSRW